MSVNMTQQFQDQGGPASMSPTPLLRWLQSKVMTHLMRPKQLQKQRNDVEHRRIKDKQPHVVEYFHQIDDGYSHLAVQLLKPLAARYAIDLRCHLVTGPTGNNSVEPELLLQLSRTDAAQIAPFYGLNFPSQAASAPHAELVQLASSILAAQDTQQWPECAAEVSLSLWANDETRLQALAQSHGCASASQLSACIASGNARRDQLKHYSGAMFYYGKEWYWGVDRLYHLEKRLAQLGVCQEASNGRHSNTEQLLAPRPLLNLGTLKDNGSLTLEIYPSLRSPYTAISFDRAVKLAEDTGVKLVVRPVLPMVMRGVPATRQKGMYIFSDTAREAREAHVPYGDFYDPIGEPVRRCYSLYPWACEQGKGNELLSSFLRAAFVEGINTNNDKGLKKVVTHAGLDWSLAKEHLGQPDWQTLVENNRLAMYNAGLWGVPSLRLLDENGHQVLALWGQDRLWLFAFEIQRLLAARKENTQST